LKSRSICKSLQRKLNSLYILNCLKLKSENNWMVRARLPGLSWFPKQQIWEVVVCSFNLQICIFLKVQRLRKHWGLGCLCATVGFPALWNPWIPGSVNKPRYFLSSAWTIDAKAFCKSFSIATWLLWRTLQTKVPDDIACCGLGSNCVHKQTHEQFSSHIHERR